MAYELWHISYGILVMAGITSAGSRITSLGHFAIVINQPNKYCEDSRLNVHFISDDTKVDHLLGIQPPDLGS